MTYDLFAHVAVPQYTLDRNDDPQFMAPLCDYRRVFLANYDSKLLAQWWGMNFQRVYLNPERTILVCSDHVIRYEIVEVP